MNIRPEKKLFVQLTRKGFEPTHVAEVGVYMPETSNILDYIEAGVRTTLVEPDPESIARIRERFDGYDNVSLHTVAAYDYEGKLDLSHRDASTFVTELQASPAIVNDGYVVSGEDQLSVACTTFDTLDDGSIDLLSIDTEGSEWFVLKYLKSRPVIISVETHGAAYVNPFIAEIKSWMSGNSYGLLYKDRSDSVYCRLDALSPNLVDRLALVFRNIQLVLRRFRKRIFR